MVKKLDNEPESTILIIMIITFIACLFLLLFFIYYLDQIYKITEQNKIYEGELRSSGIFLTIFLGIIILLLLISGTYIINKIKNKIYMLVRY